MLNTDRSARPERGIALALALFALVIIGGIVAGNFLVGLLEQQSGRSILLTAEASELAQGELWQVVSEISGPSLLLLPIGGAALDLGPGMPRPGFRLQRKVGRLADNLFLIQSRASRVDGAGAQLATAATGLLMRLSPDSASGSQILLPIGQRAWLQLY
jgi:hypothetical protein